MSALRAVFNFFYEIFLGCRHERLTRPFTIEEQTYMVCLSCGKHVFYSPDTMRPLRARELRRMRAVRASGLKVVTASTGAALRTKNGSRAVA